MSVAMDSGYAYSGGRDEVERRRMASQRVGDLRPVRRQVADRRPGGRPLEYGRARIAVSRAPHGVERRDGGFGSTVVGVLLTALVVVGLLGVAQLRSNPQAVPGRTEVVQVRGGESLSEIAARVAPEYPVSQVVERIVDLNALGGAGLQPGQSLVVPVG
ncbi:LysM peptidoglycan-binding domain-containing protein [Rhodococcus sp. NPDC127528]|uniref:LysM peptidoglycan-binding domain-containing protein n=1 Tax=unclassified Rhodococcus (in: high G+C Gram-positive bacteria) TaxID=192944 RepID=UPI003636CF88